MLLQDIQQTEVHIYHTENTHYVTYFEDSL